MVQITEAHKIFKIYFCLIICLLSIKAAVGQSAYIRKDTTTFFNVKLLKSTQKNYSKFIKQEKEKDTILTFTPRDIDAFRLKDGRVFYAFSIDSAGTEKRYFFEQLYIGKYHIYFLDVQGEQHGFYFKSSDNNPLIPIPKKRKEYREFLDSYLKDCEQSGKNIRYLDLTKARIVRLMQDYENCKGFHLPRTRLALKGGVYLNKYIAPEEDLLFRDINLPINTNNYLGISLEYPLGTSNLSIISEVNVVREANSFTFTKDIDYDFSVDAWRINVPLLLRFSFFNRKYVPFIELGPLYSSQFSAENFLISYTDNSDKVFINFRDPATLTNQLGGSLGTGMVFAYDSSLSLIVHAGINSLFPLSRDIPSFSSQSVYLSVGLLL